MRFTVFLLLVAALHLCATSYSQKITLHFNNTPLQKVLASINAQAGYSFIADKAILSEAPPVSIKIKNRSIKEVLDECLRNSSLEYRIDDKLVYLIRKTNKQIENNAPVPVPPIDVRGRVVTDKGEPAVGVTVSIKGTSRATSTSNNGEFLLTGIESKAILIISGANIETYELRVNDKTILNVTVKQKVSDLDETIVVAYGTRTQRDNVGAITVVKGADIEALPNRSFDRSLQGLVPGLFVTKGTGQPGAGVSNMVLRGISTGSDVSFGSMARNPLIVIDGVPVSQDNFQFKVSSGETPITNPLAQLNPSDIETISVLKDAVAIALYGSKAANGVILVTTKKGKIGKTVFSFRHQTDISSRLQGNQEVLNQEEYLKLLYETYKNTNDVLWTDQAILADLKNRFPTRPDGSFYPAADWNNVLFSDRAPTIANEFSVSGGNEKSNFYLNLEYTKQNGVMKKTGYDRKSMRFNFENRPASWFKMGINSTFSYNIQDYTPAAQVEPTLSPLLPNRLTNGNYYLIYTVGATSVQGNPAAILEYNINRHVSYRGLNKLYLEARFLKYLTLSSTVGVDFMIAESKEKNDPRFHTAASARISERNTRRSSLINTNMLRFDKTISTNHVLNIILGQEAQINTDKISGAAALGTVTTLPYYNQLNSPGYTISENTSFGSKQTLLSLFGQANYGYRDKYFLSSSIRRDASSKFGEQQQWGTYWSAGAGWAITSEPFIKRALPWLNYLKLRGSIGVVGNSGALDAAIRFDRISKLKYLNQEAVEPLSLGNPDVRWEKTFNWDVGMEARLLQERISVTADIYEKRTRDLLYPANLPSLAGFSSVTSNIGNINNKGIELSLSASIIRNKAFRFSFNASWSSNQNLLLKANVPLTALSGGILGNEEGRNFNSFYMPVWAGVNPADGKAQWLDSTGKPTSTYSRAKKEFVGKPQPDGFGSFAPVLGYKGFDLSIQFYYLYGAQIYDYALQNNLLNDGYNPYINQAKQALDYWKAPGDIAANPKRILNNTAGVSSPSTRYLFYSGYIRLSNLMLSYTFPRKILNPLRLSNLRIFAQGNNLATITNFSGPDPDNISVSGSTNLGYPNERTFSFGLNLSFQ